MKKTLSMMCIGAMALTVSACAPERMYSWGEYESSMYAYARDTDKQVEFQSALLDVITKNEADGKKVPPGIYAEYGYQLLEMGRTQDAIRYFEREKTTWPEAESFMNTMVAYANGGGLVTKTADKVAPVVPKGQQTSVSTKTSEVN